MSDEWDLTHEEMQKALSLTAGIEHFSRPFQTARAQRRKIGRMLEKRLHSICDQYNYPEGITRQLSLLCSEIMEDGEQKEGDGA